LPSFVATSAVGGDASADIRRRREEWMHELARPKD
jgi:hypothetical protein